MDSRNRCLRADRRRQADSKGARCQGDNQLRVRQKRGVVPGRLPSRIRARSRRRCGLERHGESSIDRDDCFRALADIRKSLRRIGSEDALDSRYQAFLEKERAKRRKKCKKG